MRTTSLCLVLLLTLATAAGAVDLATNALVEIVEGVAIAQTTALNFGVLARNNGTVTVAAADGAVTDAQNLVVDATSISQGVFMINSQAGADLAVNCTVGAMPAGITLAADDENLEVGATITVDRTTVALTGGTPANLPYTVSVTYQ